VTATDTHRNTTRPQGTAAHHVWESSKRVIKERGLPHSSACEMKKRKGRKEEREGNILFYWEGRSGCGDFAGREDTRVERGWMQNIENSLTRIVSFHFIIIPQSLSLSHLILQK
jgi:hypothetical protein